MNISAAAIHRGPVDDREVQRAVDHAHGHLHDLHHVYVQILAEFRQDRGIWDDVDESDLWKYARIRGQAAASGQDDHAAWHQILTADLNHHKETT